MERDRDMSAIVLRLKAAATADAGAEEIAHRERAHAEDVETLRGLLEAKEAELREARQRSLAADAEIQKLKAALEP
jgi:hypothetical protein